MEWNKRSGRMKVKIVYDNEAMHGFKKLGAFPASLNVT